MFLEELKENNFPKYFAVLTVMVMIRFYQLAVSPLIGPTCRFSPSCSTYALEAIRRHGLWKGTGLSVKRLLRCHPWNAGGYDPVP